MKNAITGAVVEPAIGGGLFTLVGLSMLPAACVDMSGGAPSSVESVEVDAGGSDEGDGTSHRLLILDEDAIDNGTSTIEEISFGPEECGAGSSAVCVNDDIAGLNVREILFTRGNDVTPLSDLELPTGQEGDPGLFRFTRPDPQTSLENGATFTTAEYIAGVGPAASEENLDKVEGVLPLGEAEIRDLVGETVCGLVYDSDVSVVEEGASLMGDTLGLTAFSIVDVIEAEDASSSSFPWIVIDLLPSSEVDAVCSGAGDEDGGGDDGGDDDDNDDGGGPDGGIIVE